MTPKPPLSTQTLFAKLIKVSHQVIYLPGLGDQRPWGQQFITKFWRLAGLKVHYLPIGWAGGEAWPAKLERIIKQIDELGDADGVSLVGVSAGASAALNAYAARSAKIGRVVFICGKLTHPETVNPSYYRENPAFEQSLAAVQSVIAQLIPADKAKMLSLAPLYDGTVPVADTKIAGVAHRRLLVVGHIPAIFLAIGFYWPLIGRIIARRA